MNTNTSTAQRVGWLIFAIGGLYMLGLGWLQSWWMVPAADQSGNAAFSGLLGFLWSLSVPLGAFIVAIGAALAARAEHRVIWLLILLIALFTAWQIAGTTRQMIPALFGMGGGLITVFFLGSAWYWARTRPTLRGAGKTGSDLRMLGLIFFIEAAWKLCGILGIGSFVLRPELAARFAVSLSSTINGASSVMILLVLGWGFTFLGQLVSHQARTTEPEVDKVPSIAAPDF